jgi:hypothetical protein
MKQMGRGRLLAVERLMEKQECVVVLAKEGSG